MSRHGLSPAGLGIVVNVAVGAGNTRVSMSMGIDMGESGDPIWYEKAGGSANSPSAEPVIIR
ncbi:hypothetical protein N9Z12_05690 [Opitutaceae bacterium]|nr:hypothetical protein [Opitutaceae bacterium]